MKLAKSVRYQAAAIIWAVFIFILCNIKIPESEGAGIFFEGFDKLVHVGFFYVLSVLLFYGKIRYQHNYNFRSLTIIKIVLITAFIGGGIELLQWKVFVWRDGDWWDFACDMVGVFMGIFSYILLHKAHFREEIN